jgi:hypothetical protein
MGRATPLEPWETRDWPLWERPKKSFVVIASGTSVQCDVKRTLRGAAGRIRVFGNGQQRLNREGSPLRREWPPDLMIAAVRVRVIVKPALRLEPISIETSSFCEDHL